jgi:hypothetical protein
MSPVTNIEKITYFRIHRPPQQAMNCPEIGEPNHDSQLLDAHPKPLVPRPSLLSRLPPPPRPPPRMWALDLKSWCRLLETTSTIRSHR